MQDTYDSVEREIQMKKALCVVAAGIITVGLLAVRAQSQAKAASAMDQLKALAGAWETTARSGEKSETNIRVISNGTAVEETFNGNGHSQMVTMYVPDGDKVALTHYCSMGNQPRMETATLEPSATKFDFSFVGATNLASDADAHMHHLVLQVVDGDHFSETWTMLVGGKETTDTIHFTRKKA